MRDFYPSSDPVPLDQADGLRRMFAGRRQCVIPLVANPFVGFPGVVIERLAAAIAGTGRHTLIVDAADSAAAAAEMARVDLGACVERLSPDLSYLAARGLPLEYVDTRGTAAAFLDAVAVAAPQADVIVVHANPSELVRLFMRRSARPVVLAADHPEGIKHAYAAVKLFAQRCALMTYDLLIAAAAGSPRLGQLAASLSGCADNFLGSLQREWAVVDPAGDPMEPVPAALQRLVDAQLALDAAVPTPPADAVRRAGAFA